MERAGRDDRPALDAADRPRQRRDRPDRARSRRPSPRGLAAYGESDLLCYRAEGPAPLVARQAELWDPILAWARRRYDVDFEVVAGIIHTPQPPETVERLAAAVAARDPFALAGLSPLVTISRLAADRAGAGRRRDRPRRRPGPPPRSTSNGRPSNGARMPKRPRRSPRRRARFRRRRALPQPCSRPPSRASAGAAAAAAAARQEPGDDHARPPTSVSAVGDEQVDEIAASRDDNRSARRDG